MGDIDDAMYEDDVLIAAQAKENYEMEERRIDSQNQLRDQETEDYLNDIPEEDYANNIDTAWDAQTEEDREYDKMMAKSQEEDFLATQAEEEKKRLKKVPLGTGLIDNKLSEFAQKKEDCEPKKSAPLVALEPIRKFISKAEERRFNFQNQLKEVMLQNELVDEIDLSEPISNQESQMTEQELQLDVEEGLREWSAEYDFHINNPPKEGDILTTTESDTKVLLMVELKEKAPPFIYGRAYVPEVVGDVLGWFLQSSDSQNFHGWKCIILPKARTELIRKFGLQSETIEVESLKVIRLSQSGKSLLCEIHKYGDEEVKVSPDEGSSISVPKANEEVKVEGTPTVTPQAIPYEEDTSHLVANDSISTEEVTLKESDLEPLNPGPQPEISLEK